MGREGFAGADRNQINTAVDLATAHQPKYLAKSHCVKQHHSSVRFLVWLLVFISIHVLGAYQGQHHGEPGDSSGMAVLDWAKHHGQ